MLCSIIISFGCVEKCLEIVADAYFVIWNWKLFSPAYRQRNHQFFANFFPPGFYEPVVPGSRNRWCRLVGTSYFGF